MSKAIVTLPLLVILCGTHGCTSSTDGEVIAEGGSSGQDGDGDGGRGGDGGVAGFSTGGTTAGTGGTTAGTGGTTAGTGGNGSIGSGGAANTGGRAGEAGGAAAGGVGGMAPVPDTENLRPCGTIEPDRTHSPFDAIKKLHSGQGQVKILVYGQSISEGAWWSMVRDWLKATYPKGNLVMEEHARGGCASQCLIGEGSWSMDGKTENRLPGDVYSWKPDLILFHVYGSHTAYEKIVQGFKQNTSAQVLLQTDHRTTDDPQATKDTRWSQTMSTMHVPGFAKTYGFALARIWEEWFEVMKQDNRMAGYYLSDDVHLNEEGNKLMARLIEKHLCYNPAP